MQSGDTHGAIDILDATLRKNPGNPVLYANKALALLAADSCREDAVAYIGGAPFRMHSPESAEQALALFGEASRKSPADPVFLHNMGWLKLALGDTGLACRYLRQAVTLSPFDPVCLISCGLITEHTADSAQSTDYYAQALAVAPSLWDSPFFGWLRQYRVKQSDRILSRAVQLIEHELSMDSENSLIQSRLAKLRYAQGDISGALHLLQNVTDRLQNLNRSWMLLGQIKEQSNEFAEAEMCYRKAVFLDSQDPLPPQYLANLLERKQDTTQIRDLRRKAIKNERSYRTVYWRISLQIYGLRMWNNEYYPGWLLPWLTPVPAI